MRGGCGFITALQIYIFTIQSQRRAEGRRMISANKQSEKFAVVIFLLPLCLFSWLVTRESAPTARSLICSQLGAKTEIQRFACGVMKWETFRPCFADWERGKAKGRSNFRPPCKQSATFMRCELPMSITLRLKIYTLHFCHPRSHTRKNLYSWVDYGIFRLKVANGKIRCYW